MAPGPRSRRSRELDDDLLLTIFSKVGCARQLARFALVCKRWRDLNCAVSHISFSFEAAAKELRAKEGIISSVLCRASIRAPGSLKHLRVSLFSGNGGEVHAHWLLAMTSLTKLELNAYMAGWGPAVWNAILRMKSLEELSIEGKLSTEKHLVLPQVLATGLQMTRLQKCVISNSDNNIDNILLETILATCPALAELHVECDDSLAEVVLRVASNSLKIFTMLFGSSEDILEATIHAPSLTSIVLMGPESTRIHFESAQSLQTLCIQSSYELYNVPDNLQELKLERICDLRRLPEMLVHTPMITDLWLNCVRGESDEKIDIDHILAPLVNLRNIHLDSDLMPHLQAGKRTFDSLTVHLWPYFTYGPNVCLFKALIEVHKVQSLMVHSTDMMDYQRKAINKGYAKWRFLFELSHFYPDRIKFVVEY